MRTTFKQSDAQLSHNKIRHVILLRAYKANSKHHFNKYMWKPNIQIPIQNWSKWKLKIGLHAIYQWCCAGTTGWTIVLMQWALLSISIVMLPMFICVFVFYVLFKLICWRLIHQHFEILMFKQRLCTAPCICVVVYVCWFVHCLVMFCYLWIDWD